MNLLKDKGEVSERVGANYFEYILKNNEHFANTDYKVLQNQNNGLFIKCMKMVRNGMIDLCYLTDEYRPMSSMFVGMSSDSLAQVLVNLFASVIEVRNNGFLTCQCIDISWDKIFVEQNTLKVKLVYVPFNVKVYDSYFEFENELRTRIVKLINDQITTINEKLSQLVSDLGNGSLSLEDIYIKSRSIGNSFVGASEPTNMMQINGNNNFLKLVAMNGPGNFEIVIDRDSVLIGKKQELVDKAVLFSKLISRKHCQIRNINGLYYINDEGSLNGTFVNNVRLNLGQRVLFNQGDIIRLADIEFRVV